ncbi:2-C-methyl-D-erythritol 4-phosphate cytidylyltransferase [Angustibacter peucedani]
MSTGCVVVAAGSGTRLAAGRPKAFVELAGVTLLEHAVARVLDAGVAEVVAVVPTDLVGAAAELLAGRARVVAGGADRRASVAAGLGALPVGCDVVLVHDAARALAPSSLVVAVAEAVRGGAVAVVPGLAVADTMKQVDADGVVVGTVDRDGLRVVQTPQGFSREVLERAHAAAATDAPATDDASLVEQLGLPVVVVPGDPLALKVTTADDLARAEWLLARLEP